MIDAVVTERFADPAHVAQYAEGPRRFVPGFADLHRMSGLLLAERAPADARVLVLGAGGGLELQALAAAQPGWRFDGVDPSAAMLDLARQTAAEAMARVTLHEGYIDIAPEGPFDAACCLLTLHFLGAEDRRTTLEAIRRRLKPGAPFVAAHSSFDKNGPDGELWLDRYAAFAVAAGADPTMVANARESVSKALNMLPPAQDEALLAEAGFTGVTLFYAGLTWRGWVAYA